MLQPVYRGQRTTLRWFSPSSTCIPGINSSPQVCQQQPLPTGPSHWPGFILGDKVTSCSPGCEPDSPASASCWNYRLFHTWQNNELDSNMANLILARYLTMSSSSSKNETLIIFTGLPQSFSIIMKHPSMARHSKCYLSLFSHNKKFVK